MRTLQDYLALIPSANAVQPKFEAFITALCQPGADIQQALLAARDAFNILSAVGVQLDQVGEWVGRSRSILVPITGVFFSLDDATLGLDYGIWYTNYDTNGLVSLDDTTYRRLLQATIIAAHWDGTITKAASAYAILTGDMTSVFIVDNQDMSMTVALAGNLPPPLILSLILGGYVPLKPSGVLVNYVVTSVSGSPIFGLDVENEYVSGLDVGAWGTFV